MEWLIAGVMCWNRRKTRKATSRNGNERVRGSWNVAKRRDREICQSSSAYVIILKGQPVRSQS